MSPDAEQLAYFARHGFLRIPRIVAPSACESLVEETWKLLPASWSRSEPGSWRGRIQDSCHSADIQDRAGHLKFQRKSYLPKPIYEEAFGTASALGRFAAGLIGHPLAPMRQRGLYAIAPLAQRAPIRMSHHIESHPVQLIALAYLRDVPYQSGGLWVWPGSHRAIYPAMRSKLEHVGSPRLDDAYAACIEAAPVEVLGQQGDVVIIHHRLIHSPSANYSRNIRFGFLCDYMRADYKRLCAEPPGSSLWEDWPAVAKLPSGLQAPPIQFSRDLRPVPATAVVRTPPAGADAIDAAGASDAAAQKADASAIARLREPGQVWVVISDTASDFGTIQLLPKGTSVVATGLQVVVDGQRLASESRSAFIGRFQPRSGHARIQARHDSGRLWMRVIQIRLPFDQSRLLEQRVLEPGSSHTVTLAL
jgi:hypothetical protein